MYILHFKHITLCLNSHVSVQYGHCSGQRRSHALYSTPTWGSHFPNPSILMILIQWCYVSDLPAILAVFRKSRDDVFIRYIVVVKTYTQCNKILSSTLTSIYDQGHTGGAK